MPIGNNYKKINNMFIAVDFDGTCVTHEFPNVGRDIGAVPVLKELIDNKHKLILFTIRSEQSLEDAKLWFAQHEIPLFGVNTNPIQWKFSKSRKAYANLYIDDAALGCPLIFDESICERPYADWIKIRQLLVDQGFI